MKYTRYTRPFAAAAVVVAAALAFSGCASAAPAAPTPTGPVDITFSSWLRGSQQVVDAFNASQKDVIVHFESVASGVDNYPQLAKQAEAHTLPDVVTTEYSRVADLASQGVLADLSKIAGDFVKKSYPESIQSLVTFGGKTWSVPLDAGTVQLYYRDDLFKQYGVKVPTTWDEYYTAAKAIKAADPNARIGSTVLSDMGLLAALAWQNGAQWAKAGDKAWDIHIDDDATLAWAKSYQKLLDEDLVWKDEAQALQQKQASGQLLSVISGSWYGAGLSQTFADQAGKWRVAKLPAPASGPSTGMLGGSSFGISKDSKKADAALKFIKWMTTTPEGIKARINGGISTVFPVNETARAAAVAAFDPKFFGGQDIYKVAAEGLANIPKWTWSPATATTMSALNDASAAVKAGTAPLASMFALAQKATVDALKNRNIAVN
ncbi:MAG TPA: sugar ABC transporter substrate-binding protein [Candidatus Lumbricidophila sp.]|nr:sugar ABC transporter substrate-binding protein [Candidatus Lumbricidophila sp.]